MDLLRPQRCILQQAFAQVSQIPIRVTFGCNSLIHLYDMQVLPGHILLRQFAQSFYGGGIGWLKRQHLLEFVAFGCVITLLCGKPGSNAVDLGWGQIIGR